VGTLVTLSLPPGSPVADLPWVITVGALGSSGSSGSPGASFDSDDDWEPVVCGPYERDHALALAQAVVADEDLMAVVEPLLPLVDAEAIREEIALARAAALTAIDVDAEAADEPEGEPVEPGPAPTASEVRAGFARLAAKLPKIGT
jgi:hypothetical protein